VFCGLKNGFPNDMKITTDDAECLFVHGFIFDVKTFGFDASLKLSRAQMRRSLLEASGAKGRPACK